MATLVLTAVGTAIGGPIGGALGSLVGQAIDTQLFGPGPRKGPRLDDLKLQTSSYGTQIPRLYGRMRVAGTVIWATDLEESEEIEGGGKGSPETVAYSYSCSFAVALSSRPIRSIGRIWADGKLIRGASGDLKVKGRFRMLSGSEAQSADPLIASIEGQTKTPAYRGLALAVFEDLALGGFGNRIPMLTFEVVADDAPVRIAALIEDASGNAIIDAGGERDDRTVGGYAVLGSDRRSAIEQICELSSQPVRASDDRLLAQAGPVTALMSTEELGWAADGKVHAAHGEWTQDAAGSQPATLAIRYHDPARDFQAGLMQAAMPGGRGAMMFDSAATLSASEAKAWAERALARRWAGRDRLTLRLPPTRIELAPGDQLETGWRAGRWLVEDVKIDAFAVIGECRRLNGAGAILVADPGRSNAEEDIPIGTSIVALFDLPDLGEMTGGPLQLHAAVSAEGGFKSVPLETMIAGHQGPTGLATRRARLGVAETVLGEAPATLFDARCMVDVILANPSQVLLNADDDALDAGANLCMLGAELLQFGRAVDLGGGRFRLSHLLRGRRGSEWAVSEHRLGEPFVMVDRSTLVPLNFDATMLDQNVRVTAHGVADDDVVPPSSERVLGGAASRPLSPCLLHMDGKMLKWVRRSRANWAWNDSVADAANPASYEVQLVSPDGALTTTVSGEALMLSEDELQLLGPGPLLVSIVEVSAARRSVPARATI